jgi:hypothetical protein
MSIFDFSILEFAKKNEKTRLQHNAAISILQVNYLLA